MNRYAPCKYCGKINLLGYKVSQKTCDICHKFARKMSSRKDLSSEEREEIVAYLASLPQECSYCKSKERLTIDRIVPRIKGGRYEVSNVQILCFKCNIQIKLGCDSVEEALMGVNQRECPSCHEVKPLNREHFHRGGYTAKFRLNTLANWHPICKVCRLKKGKSGFPIVCRYCNKKSTAWTKIAKYCSYKCMGLSMIRHKKFSCLYCKKEHTVQLSSKRKYCSNKCSANYWKLHNIGIYKEML